MDRNYIEKQLKLYKTHSSVRVRDDALWRIASAANLTRHPSQLDRSEQEKTIAWLRQNGFQV